MFFETHVAHDISCALEKKNGGNNGIYSHGYPAFAVELFYDVGPDFLETILPIRRANQWTDFYMKEAFVMK